MSDQNTATPPPPCPVCRAPRTWDIDPSDTDAEWFAWCETCAEGEFPSQMHPVQTEPEISEPHARMIVFTWQLGEVDEHGRTGTAIGELVVSHRPDAKAFTASLRGGVRVPHAGTSCRYQIGQPGWHLSQPIARYSRPRLLAYAARALAALRAADPAEIADVFHSPGASA
jgi:hypothetical protein